MDAWEYSVEVIKLEYGDGEEWSIHNSSYGQIKLANRLNEFGKWGWELVSLLPVVSESGIHLLPPALYATFKRVKQ